MTINELDTIMFSVNYDVKLERKYRQKRVEVLSLLEMGDEDFVKWAYIAVLDRAADAGGKDAYLFHIQNGKTKLNILLELRRSDEGVGVGKVLFIGSQRKLIRLSDSDEEIDQTIKAAAVDDEEETACLIMPETSDAAFVEWCYISILGRYASFQEQRFYELYLVRSVGDRKRLMMDFIVGHFQEVDFLSLSFLSPAMLQLVNLCLIAALVRFHSVQAGSIASLEAKNTRLTHVVSDAEASLKSFKYTFALQDRLISMLERLNQPTQE